MASFGGMYTGALCHYVYPWYPKLVTRFMPKLFQSSALWIGLGCTVIDNFIHNPIFYIPAFYMYTDVVKGATKEEAIAHIKEEWYEVASVCMAVWLPAQLATFTVVPVKWQVLFMNACSVIWSMYCSWANAQQKPRRDLD